MMASDEPDDASFCLDLSECDDADADYTERDPDAVDHVERDAEPDPPPLKVVGSDSPPPAIHRHEWFSDLTAAASNAPEHFGMAVGGDPENGPNLLYSRKVHTIFGPPGSGKSWLGALAAVECLEWTYPVLIDYEDDAASWTSRLLGLGLAESDLGMVDYVRPTGPLTTDAFTLDRVLRHIGDGAKYPEGGLVVIDSVGRAMASDGLSESNPQHVMAWMNALPVALTRLGWTVLLIDHQGKTVGDSPTESFRKIAEVAAAYRVAPEERFSVSRAGYARLVVKKDRYGTYTEGETVAEFIVQPPEDGDGITDFTLAAPGTWRRSHGKRAGASGHATPGSIPENVLAATYDALVAAGEALSKNDWKKAVRGHDLPSVNEAMIALLDGADPERLVSFREAKRGRARPHMCWPSTFPDRAPAEAP